MKEEKVITISLWTTKADEERYDRRFYPNVLDILKPFLTASAKLNYRKLETALCGHFEQTLAA
jgi:hypothetical protein